MRYASKQVSMNGTVPTQMHRTEPQFQPAAGSLRIRDVKKALQQQDIVRGISLVVEPGQIVGLLGPNGAGKSTLIGLIAGVQLPDTGKIEIDGVDATKLPLYARAQLGVAYLPQEASVFRGLSVEDNILLYLEAVESDRAEISRRLESLLNEFGLTKIRRRKTAVLSGGERRRCEIARMIAGDPKYVLLDEPFAGVDPLAISSVQQTIIRLKERGMGVVISDHNVRETLSIVDRANIMHAGALLAQGTAEELIKDLNVRNLFLGDIFNQ